MIKWEQYDPVHQKYLELSKLAYSIINLYFEVGLLRVTHDYMFKTVISVTEIIF